MRDTKVAVLYLMLAYSKPMLNWIWKSHLNQESEQATWIVLMMTASCPLTKIQFKPSSRIYCSLVGFFHIQSITQHIYNQHHLPLAIGGGGGLTKSGRNYGIEYLIMREVMLIRIAICPARRELQRRFENGAGKNVIIEENISSEVAKWTKLLSQIIGVAIFFSGQRALAFRGSSLGSVTLTMGIFLLC